VIAGRYFEEIGRTPLLGAEEEEALGQAALAGDRTAREHLICANLRLVVKIAGDFAYTGVPREELVAEGNVGLIKAVDRYDPRKGARLCTYAAWWIRQAIYNAVARQTSAVGLPPSAAGKLGKLRRVCEQLANELGHEPSDDEIADELGLTPAAVTRLKNAALRPFSLDAPVSDENSAGLGARLADEETEDAAGLMDRIDSFDNLGGLLSVLNAREREVVARRFGLGGTPAERLQDVARRFGLTRERVRQIQDKALRKMRNAHSRREATRFLSVADAAAPAAAAPVLGRAA
jgi:RNA polymerase primary sigma factor